jgi:aryl-alcohol dehydrogenase-like predicted oxidoreductase
LKNLDVEKIDLLQFHTWDDSWSSIDEWKRSVEDLKKSGKISAIGISMNRWEPENGIKALKTGLIDSVQVIYNIFDQAPEDKLFPLCKDLDVGVIARVPFDEGTLTGNINLNTVFPKDDWRSTYFVPENLKSSVNKVDKIRPLIPVKKSIAEVALRFILMNKEVATIIPGMRKKKNVISNISTSDGKGLDIKLYNKLKNHRWDRKPTSWSQ